MSARDFSRAVGVPDNNTQNYLEPRYAQPKVDYLERIMLHFESINPRWLLTGQGEPFLPTDPENSSSSTHHEKKISQAQVVGSQRGKARSTMHMGDAPAAGSTQQELEFLRAQLAMQQSLIESKDALIKSLEEQMSLLRASYNRPN